MKKNGTKPPKKKSRTRDDATEQEQVRKLWESMPEEARDELMRLAEESGSEDEFVRTVFVGDCPRCESGNTAMPEGPDGEEDLTVGVCRTCGYVWCLECDKELVLGVQCAHWDICENCEELEQDSGMCSTSPEECGIIQEWLSQKQS